MKANFTKAYKFVQAEEGGYANHRDDPGGATQWGLTQAVYDAYRARVGRPVQDVRLVSAAEHRAIFEKQYWTPIKGNDLPSGVDLCLYDYSINSGAGRAVKELQRALGLAVDGIVGVRTLDAVRAADDETLINDICDRRLRFMKSLRTWKTFGKGWTARVGRVRRAALELARGQDDAATPLALLSASASQGVKAPESNQAQLKTADGAGLASTTVGGLGQTAVERAQEIQPHFGDTVLGRAAIAVFVLLMVFGLGLLAYSQLKRVGEKGGLNAYIRSFLQ